MMRIATNLLLCCCMLLVLWPVSSVPAAQESLRPMSRSRCKVRATRNQLERRRFEIHQLMLRGKCGHAGAADLMEIGKITSVPALLRLRRDNPPVERANGHRVITSTAALAIAALRKITGLNIESYEEWVEWWQRSSQYYKN